MKQARIKQKLRFVERKIKDFPLEKDLVIGQIMKFKKGRRGGIIEEDARNPDMNIITRPETK